MSTLEAAFLYGYYSMLPTSDEMELSEIVERTNTQEEISS